MAFEHANLLQVLFKVAFACFSGGFINNNNNNIQQYSFLQQLSSPITDI